MKYVMLLIGNIPCPVIFPDSMTHSLMVPRDEPTITVRSSGFFSSRGGKVKTFGESGSLKGLNMPCKPHRDDAALLTCALLGEEALLPFYAVPMTRDPVGRWQPQASTINDQLTE